MGLDSGKRNEACDPMKKKLKKLSFWSFVLALVNFGIAYIFYHYMSPDGQLSNVFHDDPGKPFVSLLFGVFGTHFLFAGCMSGLVNRIFFREEKKSSLV
jgi:hypothetical protein